jgi:hypothetical protein
MKKLTYLLLCMSLSTSVSAEWQKVLDAETESFFIDPTSRVVVGEITTAVVLVNYKELKTIDGFPAKSSRVVFKFNCAKKKIMVASITAYDGLQEAGIQRVVLTESKAKEEWINIGRQPTGELLNAACVR